MKKVFILALSFIMGGNAIMAKDKETVTIIPVAQSADAINDGIIYSLPKTMLRVKVEAELTIKKTGPYYRYSNKYLNLSNVVTEDSKTWKLGHVEIESYGVADKERTYKMSGNELPALRINENGVIVGINVSKICNHKCKGEKTEPQDVSEDLSFDGVKLDRTVLTKTSTAAMAEEAALAIYRLREKRLSLLGGEDATILHDEGSYEKVLSEIDKLENEYLSLFTGKVKTIKVVKYFDVEPGARSLTSSVLFRFSETDGFMDAMDITGKPVYIDIDYSDASRLNAYQADSKQRKQNPVVGFRYIIPGTINVKVIDRSTLLVEKNILCTQNGQEASLPLNMISDGYSIRLNTVNGSLESVQQNKKENVADKKK